MTASAKMKIVITGGTRGIGLACAKRFLDQGHKVWVTGTRERTQKLSEAEHGWFDFANTMETDACAEWVRKISPDVLICNVGIEKNGPFLELKPSDFKQVLDVNLYSSFLLSQAALPGMIQRGFGRLIFTSSVWGKVSRSYRAAYSASKWAIEGLSSSLADEFAEKGITSNCIAPGFINIDATAVRGRGDARNAELAGTIPMRRMGKPDEVAGLIQWLSSPESSYITGQSISVDGGFVASGARTSPDKMK